MKSTMRQIALIAVAASMFVSAIWADEAPPGIQWQKSYGGTGDDWLTSLQQTSDGGYIIGGTSQSGVSGNKTSISYGGYDYWVVKLDAEGNKIWEQSFGGSGDDQLASVQQTSDGGYLLGGESNSDVSGNKTTANYGAYDYWVIKLDANGNKVWEKSLGDSGDDRLTSVQQTRDGGYVLGGYSDSGVSSNKTSSNYGNSDYWVVKLDADGNKVWENSFGGDSGEILHTLQQTSDNGYVLGGESTSAVSGNKTSANYGEWDYWVVKLDVNGNKVWDRSFGGASAEYLWAVQQISGGAYILGGSSQSYPSGNKTSPNYSSERGAGTDYWIVKLDGDGNKLWDKSFGGEERDFLISLQETGGSYLLGGFSASDVSGNKTTPRFGAFGSFDSWVLKLDVNGNKVWDASFGGNSSDALASLQRTSTGYILGGSSASGVSGNKTSPNYGGHDFWIVKLEGPPVITTQPQSRTAAVGDPVTFSVVASGASPLTYRWLFNGANIAGATGPTLTLLNTTHAQAGFYSVIVSNAFGTVTSARAQLMFSFLALRMYAGLTIDGQAGQSYRIEYLPAPDGQNHWQGLTNVTLTNTSYVFIDLDSPKSPQRFYRALLLP